VVNATSRPLNERGENLKSHSHESMIVFVFRRTKRAAGLQR